jgi:hypothetical protein
MKKTLWTDGLLGVSQSHPLEKKCKKPLDNSIKVCYNIDTEKR